MIRSIESVVEGQNYLVWLKQINKLTEHITV